MKERRCRICGCDDLSACLDSAGRHCCWIEDDLCSVCQELILDPLFEEISRERLRQDAKWGGPEQDDERCPQAWHDTISRNLDEAERAERGDNQAEYRRTMIQTAATILAAIQSHDRRFGGTKISP